MERLSPEKLFGIWAGITMSWDEKDRFDDSSYIANAERMCAAGIHGIYTTGSTGEFYALDYDEFCRMVDIQDEICGKYGMPLQIGCCADSTRKIMQLLGYVAEKSNVGGAQVVIPYWMEMTDREVIRYFRDLYNAFPDMPLIHYNIPRAKRYLGAEDYLRILDVAPSLIGVKFAYAGSNFLKLQDAIQATPHLSYFVGEDLLVSGMIIGARGCYSSLVATEPSYILKMFRLAEEQNWDEAMGMQLLAAKFFNEAAAFVESHGEGCIDPVFDKGMAIASGCCVGSQRTRAPYIGWSDDMVLAFQNWLRENYPMFIYRREQGGLSENQWARP